MNSYRIHRCVASPELNADWNQPAWHAAETLEIKNFRPESSAHHPQTSIRLLHNVDGLHGIFFVRDQYVRCTRKNYFDDVWKDSCVEFFVQPREKSGYFNFEFNCGGAHLCNYITDWRRTPAGFAAATKIPAEVGKKVRVKSSLPPITDPEITTPLNWTLQFRIPFEVLEKYVGSLGDLGGQTWRGNFYKCGDETSHPHWASWSPVDEKNFHLPRCFGQLILD
jgi:hypothetical protein